MLVDAPEEIRIQRLVRDRGLSEGAARRMVEAQLSADEKRTPSTYIIENDGTPEEMRAQAAEVWREIAEQVK